MTLNLKIGALALLALALAACAASPEQRLKAGYDTVNAYATTNSVLLQRGHIKRSQGQSALGLAQEAKTTLDIALVELKACRAAEASARAAGKAHAGCEAVGSQVLFAQGLLVQLEAFLESRVAKEAAK